MNSDHCTRFARAFGPGAGAASHCGQLRRRGRLYWHGRAGKGRCRWQHIRHGHAVLEVLKDVPTYAEKNLFSNNDASWFGLLAPSGTPVATVNRINHAVATALQDKALRDKLVGQGLFASGTKPDDFAAQIRKEIDKMQRIAKFAQITLD